MADSLYWLTLWSHFLDANGPLADSCTSILCSAAHIPSSRIRAQKERLAALRANDMAAYVGLVAVAGSSQLDKLLCQTDACLRQLTARLSSTRAVSSVGKGLEGPGTDCSECGCWGFLRNVE